MVVAALLIVLVALFLAFGAMSVPLLADPSAWLTRPGPEAALLGVVLLTVDVLVPVPSNLVMIANGALFGFWPGALLSVAGSLCAAVVSFAIGRLGGPLMSRLLPLAARERSERMLHRWGGLAILASRPLPILAEAVMILAGASTLSWWRALALAVIGSVPASVLYALMGVSAFELSGVVVVALSLLVAVVTWMVGRYLVQPTTSMR